MSQDHPLLQYSVMTDPMPLQQGKSNGKIIILASNPGIYSDQPATNYVEPTAIVFDFSAVLTANAGTISASGTYTPSGGNPVAWALSNQVGTQFTFTAPAGEKIISTDTLMFVFENIEVSDKIAAVRLSVTETASSPGDSLKPGYPTRPKEERSTVESIGIFPADFVFTSFTADKKILSLGQSTTLSWVATEMAHISFTLSFADNKGIQTVTQHALPDKQGRTTLQAIDIYPSTALDPGAALLPQQSTTFTLAASYTGDESVTGNASVTVEKQVTVDVLQPRINATTLEVLETSTLKGNVGVGRPPGAAALAVTGNVTGDSLTIGTGALVVDSKGDVGIGTASPGSKLSVCGNLAIGSSFASSGAPASGLLVEGSVGIGTTNPAKAKLEVAGVALFQQQNTFAFYSTRIADGKLVPWSDVAGGPIYISIYADGRIVGIEFDTFSDARMKDVVGRSDAAQDLATLMRLDVTDYTYRDRVTRGDRPHKKLVGQQVRGVYPQAVSLSTEVLPDIYREAEASDGWIEIDTTLRKGDRVKIIPQTGGESVVEVVDVAPDRFRVSPSLPDGPVFVYGREVTDFHVVDYDAIAMLNVSATQQIKKEKDAEVESLRRENAVLRDEAAALGSRLERLEKLVAGLAPTIST